MNKEELHAFASEKHGNIRQIVALKDGKMFYEDTWEGYMPEDTLHVMSVTKSVTALLIGIAIDKGFIGGVNQRVLDFFPDYTVKRGEKTIQRVTLEQLLTMTAPYKYRSEPWSKICSGEDWTRGALDILGGKNGITGEFKYSTLGIHILTGVIASASGMTVEEFSNRFLFAPLGIAPRTGRELETVEEHRDFILSKRPKGDVWLVDAKGVNTAGWGLCLSARDMAKIGQMCLDDGVYNGKRVVSGEWLTQCVSPHFKCDERFANMSYGYLWWLPDEGSPCYAAIGDGGNVIYVDPARGIVVSVAATFKPRVFDRVQFIQEHIVPLAL